MNWRREAPGRRGGRARAPHPAGREGGGGGGARWTTRAPVP